MAYGIGAAATRLAKLVKGGADEGRNTRLALVLRLENVVQLRASIGQARMDQMLDRLTLRLVSEARLLPQTRGAGATEKPPPRLRRGEISATQSHCSRRTYISINDKKG